MAKYNYDAWGKLNPFLYRGYYFDAETGLYYLNSRYYDAQTGRFINEDGQFNPHTGMTGNNLFAYCNNNPILMGDDTGTRPIFTDGQETAEDRRLSYEYMTYEYIARNKVSVQPSSSNYVSFSKKATARPDSGLQGIPDEEISRKARDKSLSGEERRRYQTEEKIRENRNKQKRQSNIMPDIAKPIIQGGIAIGAGYLVYRGARMIPSLFPALWWTIPLNVATP